jgi:hypothetical protein
MSSGHATLSPSSASRWLACTPSARLEERFPDTAGEFAKEGSLAHELGELLLNKLTGRIKKAEFTKALERIESDPLFNEDMREHATNYAVFVMEQFAKAQQRTPDAVLQIETRLDFTDYVPEGFGTGDAVIIADGTLEIIDLKYGKGVPVSSTDNNQMKLYALGALQEFDVMYDIDAVRMTIYQPRLDNISSWEMGVAPLRKWAKDELKPKAEIAFEGGGIFVAGSHCRFCRAKAQCKALAEQQLEIAKYEFADAALLTDAEVSDILTRADTFTNWIGAVAAFALQEAVDKGKHWPGYKLVEGRSTRIYTDKEQVAGRLMAEGYDEDRIAPRSLLGITAMEKLLMKKGFESLLSDLVVKPQGKPTLVPETDKRPEIGGTESAKKDFSEL